VALNDVEELVALNDVEELVALNDVGEPVALNDVGRAPHRPIIMIGPGGSWLGRVVAEWGPGRIGIMVALAAAFRIAFSSAPCGTSRVGVVSFRGRRRCRLRRLGRLPRLC
jgi:hypothetical protein